MKKLSKNNIAYWYFRLVKQSGTPESIARGVAIGFFIGFMVPFGLQMLSAFALAFLLKARKIPAMGCTWVTNHFTVPIIYPLQCYVGSLVLRVFFRIGLTLEDVEKKFEDLIENPGWGSLFELGGPLIVSFFIGGALFGIPSAIIGYFTALGLLSSHHKKRKKRFEKRLARINQSKEQMLEENGKDVK